MAQQAACTASQPIHYERRRPEHTLLYELVQEHVETFFVQAEAQSGGGLPDFVKAEFDAFLDCGVLANGFLRLRCGECADEKLVAFSCGKRGFCTSCGGRRMAQTAAHLVDHVIPEVPVRQWVLSFPIPLRLLFAAHPELLSPMLQIVHRGISTLLRKQAGGLKRHEAHTGAVTLIQRFGSALNLNIHIYPLVLDGGYRVLDGSPVFVPTPAPTFEQLQALLERLIKRIINLLTRQGYLIEESGQAYMAESDGGDSALAPLQSAAATYRIAFGPRAGQKVLTLRTIANEMPSDAWQRGVNAHGFSLHAARRCDAHQREELERLCRYITRPAISNERLSLNPAGDVVLKLKSPFRDGTTHIVMSPLEFLGRLAALVPRPKLNLIRFHGVLAPNAKWRAAIVPTPPVGESDTATDSASTGHGATTQRMSWARLLKRVFAIDAEQCPSCGAPMKIIAAIEEPSVIVKILSHLGLPARPPARSPPPVIDLPESA